MGSTTLTPHSLPFLAPVKSSWRWRCWWWRSGWYKFWQLAIFLGGQHDHVLMKEVWRDLCINWEIFEDEQWERRSETCPRRGLPPWYWQPYLQIYWCLMCKHVWELSKSLAALHICNNLVIVISTTGALVVKTVFKGYPLHSPIQSRAINPMQNFKLWIDMPYKYYKLDSSI